MRCEWEDVRVSVKLLCIIFMFLVVLHMVSAYLQNQ